MNMTSQNLTESQEVVNYGFGFLGGVTTIIIQKILLSFYNKFCKRSDVYGFDQLENQDVF